MKKVLSTLPLLVALGYAVTDEQKKAFVDAHNKYRGLVSDPYPKSMPAVVWDDFLGTETQKFTDKCVWEHSKSSERNYFNGEYTGENLYAGWGNEVEPEDALVSWTSEVKDFIYPNGKKSESAVTGHYTQVVWAKSIRIGCGMSYCNPISGLSWAGTIVACRYYPGGNMNNWAPYENTTENCNTCAAMGYQCGTYTDNCSKTVTCNSCNSSEKCINHMCVSNSCVPKTTCTSEYECGTMYNGCGEYVACATCGAGTTCNEARHKCMYTVTFDFDNGTAPVTREFVPGDRIEFPESPTKEGHRFSRWNSSTVIMPANHITITAQWTVNRYTVAFYLTNTSFIERKTLHFNETIVYPKDLQNENLTFNGWDMIPSFMPAQNINITALWRETPPRNVEIELDKVDLKKGDIVDVAKFYTNETFTVEYKAKESKAWIKFADETMCVEFVRNINENKREEDSFIIRANGVDYVGSFSFISVPSVILGALMM